MCLRWTGLSPLSAGCGYNRAPERGVSKGRSPGVNAPVPRLPGHLAPFRPEEQSLCWAELDKVRQRDQN